MRLKIKSIGKKIGKIFSKHAPEILTVVGVIGVTGGTVAVVKATKKSEEDIRGYIENSEDDVVFDENGNVAVPFKKKVELCWKNYIPATAILVSSVGCFVGSAGISARRTAAITTAYQLSQEKLNEYRKKLHESLKEDKANKAEDDIADNIMKKHASGLKKDASIPMFGDQLYYDPYSDRWFMASTKDIYDACRELNDTIHDAPFDVGVCLNDLYDKIGLKPTRCGKLIGWNEHIGLISFHPRGNAVVSPDGRSSLIFDFDCDGSPTEGWDEDGYCAD